MTRIKVHLHNYRGLYIVGSPVRSDISGQIADYLKQYGVRWSGFFAQDDVTKKSMLEDFGATPADAKALDSGYDIVKLVEPDMVCAWVGYNAYDDLRLKV